MYRKGNRRTVVALLGIAVVGTGFTLLNPVPAAADARINATADVAPSVAHAPLVAAQVRGSISYLEDMYHVSQAEALRRLELQRDAVELGNWLTAKHPEHYSGLWLDQAGGGLLDIATTRPDILTREISHLSYRKSIRAVQKKWSLADLRATQDRLNAKINVDPNAANHLAEVTINPEANTVDVYQHSGENETSALAATAGTEQIRAMSARILHPDARIDAAVAAESGRASLHQMVTLEPKAKRTITPDDTPVYTGCEPRSCPPPMRAGMRLNVHRNQAVGTYPNGDALNAWWGECTNGFNVTDNRGWNYIMTAGHCTVGDGKIGNTMTYSRNGTPIGYEIGDFENGGHSGSTYPVDYAIQPYQGDYVNYWIGTQPANLADSYCWPSTNPCTEGSFAIHGYYNLTQIGAHFVACMTGTGDADPASGYHRNGGVLPGTRCGETKDYYYNGGVITNICSREGDSGGPLFSEIDGMAYGILSDGTKGTGACPTNGSEESWFSPLDKVFSHVNWQLGYYDNLHLNVTLRTTR